MNEGVSRLVAELILELSKCTPEEYLQFKLMMLAYPRQERVRKFLQVAFTLAEERRPLLLEMK